MLDEYNKHKNKLAKIYDNIAEDVKVRSKIPWYEEGAKRKIIKLFFKLRKNKSGSRHF